MNMEQINKYDTSNNNFTPSVSQKIILPDQRNRSLYGSLEDKVEEKIKPEFIKTTSKNNVKILQNTSSMQN